MVNSKNNFKEEFKKRLISFTVETLKLCRDLREDRNLWAVADQVARSAASVGANVSEAKGASSIRDYKHYFEIALKSANETKYWFLVIKEYSGDSGVSGSLERELDEVIKILSAAILTMRGKRKIQDS